MAAPQAADFTPLSPYDDGVLDEELQVARDFAESTVQNPAGLECAYYALWDRWMLILKAAVTSRVRARIPPPPPPPPQNPPPPPPRLVLLNLPQHDVYVSKAPNDVALTDEDVITPRPQGQTRSQIPDGSIQFVWRQMEEILARVLVNIEVKPNVGPRAGNSIIVEGDRHDKQVRLQALLSIGSMPGFGSRVGAILSVGRYWRWTVLSPGPTTPLVSSARNVREWADNYGAQMRHTGPGRGPHNISYWSDFFSLDNEESPEHAAAFEELVQTITDFCRIS